MADKRDQGPGQPDYGYNNPTGGTDANHGEVDPQSPTKGTEDANTGQQTGNQRSSGEAHSPGNLGTGPVSPNLGDMKDESGSKI
jgi:hypothetical protein